MSHVDKTEIDRDQNDNLLYLSLLATQTHCVSLHKTPEFITVFSCFDIRMSACHGIVSSNPTRGVDVCYHVLTITMFSTVL